MLEILRVIKTEKGATSVLSLLKKSGLDNNLDQLFPTNKRTAENIKNVFISSDQQEIVTYLAGQCYTSVVWCNNWNLLIIKLSLQTRQLALVI